MSRISSLFVLFVAVGIALASAEADVDSAVVTLTNENFREYLDSNEFVFVKFFSPNCGHCKRLAPDYETMAGNIAKSNPEIKVTEVDCSVAQEVCGENEVRGYPTMKLFKGEAIIEYSGGRSDAEMASWLVKKCGVPIKVLKDAESVDSFKNSADVIVIALLEDDEGADAKDLMKIADGVEDVEIGLVMDKDLVSELEKVGDVVMFKKFDDPITKFGEKFTYDSVIAFVNGNKNQLVPEFLPETAGKILSLGRAGKFIFFFATVGEESEQYKSEFAAFTEAAKEHRDEAEMRFVLVDINKPSSQRIVEYFEATAKEGTDYTGIISFLSMEKNLKYPFTGEFKAEAISQFVADVKAGKLEPTLRSDPVTEEDAKALPRVLVGKNIEEVVYDKSKTVMVMFYQPGCGHCQKLKPIFQELAEKMREENDVIIANCNVQSNEFDLEGLQIRGVPTIALWKAETNELVKYEGDRTLDDMMNFVKDAIDGGEEDIKEEL